MDSPPTSESGSKDSGGDTGVSPPFLSTAVNHRLEFKLVTIVLPKPLA